MKLRDEELEEALQQLDEVEDMKEENKRMNTTIKKMKDKHGDKDSSVEVVSNFTIHKCVYGNFYRNCLR